MGENSHQQSSSVTTISVGVLCADQNIQNFPANTDTCYHVIIHTIQKQNIDHTTFTKIDFFILCVINPLTPKI